MTTAAFDDPFGTAPAPAVEPVRSPPLVPTVSGKPIVLTLPYPISANRYWISFYASKAKRVFTGPTKEATAYKQQVGWLAKAAGLREPLAGRVAVDIKLYPKLPKDWEKRVRLDPQAWDDTVMCLDLDNVNKVLFDAFKGVVIDDDKWVRRLTSERMEPDGEARVVVTITPLVKANPQEVLL